MASVKILVVEDEAIVAKDIADTLKDQGYDVPAIALSGEQAIEETERIQPDLVLMDIVLGGDVDGIEAAEQIRRRFDIPVLYLTAYTDEQTVQRARITEPFGYITKPFDKRELYTNIEMALYKHKTEKALRRSKQEWENTLDAIPDWVVLIDLKGQILRSNHAGEEFVGVPLAGIVGQTCCKLLHGSDAPPPGCPLLKMLRTGRSETMQLQLPESNRWLAITVDPVKDEKGTLVGAVHITREITERKLFETEQELTIELLHLLNATNRKHELMELATKFLKDWSQCEAIGIRLREGEDVPYYVTSGFPDRFILAGTELCTVNELGEIERDSQGRPYLECMCGNVISSRFDPSQPFFTEHGSFWTNSTTEMLAGTTEADRMVRTRNRCNTAGYESVALIPLRAGRETFGLLQFNDKQKGRFTPERISMFERLTDCLAIALAQRRAEEALRESEQKYRALVEQSLQGIIILQGLQIVFANPTAAKIAGLTVDEVLALSPEGIKAFIPVEERAAILQRYEERLADKLVERNYELRLVRKNGEGFWLDVFVSRIEYLGKSAIQVAFIDITERKKTENSRELVTRILQYSSELGEWISIIRKVLKSIQEYSELEVAALRLREGDDYPYFVQYGFSDEFVQAGNYLCERNQAGDIVRDYKGNPVLDCMCGNIIRGRTDPKLPFFTQGGSFWSNCTTELLANTTEKERQSRTRNRCNGEGYESVALIPIRAGVEIIGLLQLNDRRKNCFSLELIRLFEGIAMSIGSALERRKALEEVLALSKFPSENPSPILRIAEDGEILYSNKAGLELLAHWNAKIGEKAPEKWRCLIKKMLESAKPGLQEEEEEEEEVKDKIFSVVIAPVVESGYVNLYARDITERRKAEAEARDAQQELIEQQRHEKEHVEAELAKLRDELVKTTRLAAIGQVSASIAHDLRNPLGSVRNASYFLRRRLSKDEPKASEHLKIIDQEVARADQIISNLLEMAQPKASHKQEVDLAEIVEEVFGQAKRIERVRCRTSLVPDPFMIKTDPNQLRQVISNIISNAVYAMKGHGDFLVEATRESDYDTLSFKDTGPGFAPEVIDRLFEPLITTKASGTGLGLTICRQIVEKHDGTIHAEDCKGGGAVIRIRLPRQ
jgi:PAS domain S-box-containing protein